uniref:Uncharacterized protein n=2 Tax=Timema TaxID=61471 RepID=A0A7R9DWK1_TIMPO|nr:unnamed protein product [Timema douglasi]CAD7422171.1 unnamed protein product [Timema poppensis]
MSKILIRPSAKQLPFMEFLPPPFTTGLRDENHHEIKLDLVD